MKDNQSSSKERQINFTMIPNSLIRSRSISSQTLRLLCVLKSLNPSYPSYSKIRQWTGLSRKSISKGIKRLKKLGIISYIQGGNNGKSNRYSIQPETQWNFSLINPDWFKNDTRSGSQSALIPVQKVNANNNNNKINEIECISLSSSFTTEKKNLDSYQKSQILKYEADLHRELQGSRYFQNLPKIVSIFVTKHGDLIPFSSLANLIHSSLHSGKRKATAEELIIQLKTIYSASLCEFKSKNAPTESSRQYRKRIAKDHEKTLQRLHAEGKLESSKQIKNRLKRNLERSLKNPIFKGVFGSDEAAQVALKNIHFNNTVEIGKETKS